MLRIIMIVTLLCIMVFGGSVLAAPLTNFDDHNAAITLGVWKPDIDVSDLHQPPHQATSYDFPEKWQIYGEATLGIGGKWGIQYRQQDMDSGDITKLHYNGRSQEFNLVYSLNKNLALFGGLNHVEQELTLPGMSVQASHNLPQFGVVGKAPIGNNVDAYGLVGAGSHSLFQAETGVAVKVAKDWEVNVGYRWFRIKDSFNDSFTVGGNGLAMVQACTNGGYDPNVGGTVRASGIMFGITHYFGSAPKKPAPVVTPQVVPPTVHPPTKFVLKNVNFDFDKDTLQPQAYPTLNEVAALAKNNPTWDFLLVGHTDGIGTDAYNMDLSKRRVQTVQRYLLKEGVDANMLHIDWKGKREPIATNDTPEGRAQNRRVELHIDNNSQ